MTEAAEQERLETGKNIKSGRPRNSGFWAGLIMLVVLGLGGVGYYWYSSLRDQQAVAVREEDELQDKFSRQQQQLNDIAAKIAELEGSIAGKDAWVSKSLADFSKQQDEKLQAMHKELNEAILRVQRQLGKTRGDWLVADAEYLLSVANERLHLVGDVNTTREALEAADQRLRESGDAAVYKVREQIALEISLLDAVTLPDIVGLYAKIDSLEDWVDKLTLILPYAGKPLTGADANNEQAPAREEQGLMDTVAAKLEGIVTVRRTDQAIDQILSPEEARFIREQLRVKLEMAKIALVQRNEALYGSSLADAREWLGQHFIDNDESRKLLAQISQLESVKILSQFPDISKSLKMLRDITKLRIETDKALDHDDPKPPVEEADTAPTAPKTATPEETGPETHNAGP